MEKPKDTKAPPPDLAQRIYIELVARNAVVEQGSVKMTASAANLATLSLKLAEAFVEAEQQAVAAKTPVTTGKLEASDIASWMK